MERKYFVYTGHAASIGLVSLFVSGGLSGIILGNSALDIQLHDTYFVVAHFHLVMGSAAAFGLFSVIYHWFPKMFGRMMNQTFGQIHFWFTFLGVYLIFIPMHYVGIAVFSPTILPIYQLCFLHKFMNMNIFIFLAAIFTVLAQFIFLNNFLNSILSGKSRHPPMESNTLEWTTRLNLGHGNWVGEIPAFYRLPYDYSKPGSPLDYIPQNIPYSKTPESNFPHENSLINKETQIEYQNFNDLFKTHHT